MDELQNLCNKCLLILREFRVSRQDFFPPIVDTVFNPENICSHWTDCPAALHWDLLLKSLKTAIFDNSWRHQERKGCFV